MRLVVRVVTASKGRFPKAPDVWRVKNPQKVRGNQFDRNPESRVAPRSRSDDRGVVLYLEEFDGRHEPPFA